MKKRRGTAAVLIILLLLLQALPALAAETDPPDRTVRMGFFEFSGMFGGAGEGQRKSGYCYEYMMRVATYTGWNYEFCYGSYAELYDMLKRGEIDVLPYTNYNEARAREVLFSDKALAEEEYYLAVPAGRNGGPESLQGRVITTLEGADYNDLLTEYLDANGIKAEVVFYPNLEETWNAVRDGKADATVFTSNAYSAENWNCICSFGKKPTYIAVAAGREDLLGELNEAIDLIDIDSPAFLGELYAQYFSDNPMRRSISPEEQRWIDAHPVLRVGGFLRDEPYLFSVNNETGEATGLTPDVISGIIERLNISASAEYRGYASLQEMEDALDAGEIDVIIPFYPDYNIALEHDLIISNTVRVSNMELVYPKGVSYEEALKTVATPSTRLGIYYVRDFFPESEIIGAASPEDAVNRVLNGEASGAIAQNVVIHSEMEKHGNMNYVVLPEGCGTCFAARPENFPLIRILNRGLNYFTAAEISAIAAKYNPEPVVTTTAYFAAHKEAVVLLAVIIVILVVLAVSLVETGKLKKKADQASRSKTAFLFNMSHDIRTPLNAITGFTGMAKKSVGDGERVTEYLDKIDIAGQQLLSLVNQILEMARIESGKIELAEEPTDVRREYASVTTVLAEQAAAAGLAFHPSLEGLTHDRILADTARMNSVTLNIAGNAMKYTPPGGTVDFCLKEVSPRKEGCATLVFTVEDTGIGMSQEFLKTLFEPFSREKNSTVSRIQGAGLGMSIVKSIVDLMGGDIAVKSEPGKGTRFDVTLDFKIDAEAEELWNVTENEKPVSFEGCRILLVEDNDMNREIAADILTDAGFEVEEAENGAAAVETVRAKGADYYGFILMDIQMPVMDGYEATRAIRELYPDTHVPIIALSANAFAEDRKQSIEAGMDDHVAKPIKVQELIAALSRFA